VGYRGTGKSTVGRLVAERLGWPFIDADRELEAMAGRSIAEIFAEEGEGRFRDLEASILSEVSKRPGVVLATGGGVVLREPNRKALKDFGRVIWLTAAPEVLANRLRDDRGERPALTAAGTLAEIATVLETRVPLYREVAHAVVATDGRSAEEVAEAVLGCLGQGGGA
jgi:shikimate kinase